MSKGHAAGKIIGGFEIIRKTGSFLEANGTRQGMYCVRCRRCGGEVVMKASEIRAKKNCGCVRRANGTRRNWISAKSKRIPWMSEEEIYREWKTMRDRDIGYSILAELNDVPVKMIVEIVRRQEEK